MISHEILKKMIFKEELTDKDIEFELFTVCCDLRLACSPKCLVFALNGERDNPEHSLHLPGGCRCDGDGKRMHEFIVNWYAINVKNGCMVKGGIVF